MNVPAQRYGGEVALLERVTGRAVTFGRRVQDHAPVEPPKWVEVPTPGLESLLVVIIQRWRLIVATAVVAGLSALIALPFLTPQYEVSASLLYRMVREPSSGSLARDVVGPGLYMRAEDLGSEIEVLKSQRLVEMLVNEMGTDYFLKSKEPQTFFEHVKAALRAVVRGVRTAISEIQILLGLERRLTPYEQVVSDLQASLNFEAVKKADVISVTLRSASREAGVEVLGKFLNIYLTEHGKVFRTAGTAAFLATRVGELKEQLSSLEEERRLLGKRTAVWDFSEQRKLLLQRQTETRNALAKTQDEISRNQSDVSRYGRIIGPDGMVRASTSSAEQANPVVQGLQIRIAERRSALERLKLTAGDQNQRVKDEEAEIANLQQLLAVNSRSVAQSDQLERRNRTSSLTAQETRQTQELAQIERSLAALDEQGESSNRIQREINLVTQSYQLYATKLEEAHIAEALDAAKISNIAVVGVPSAGLRPVAPRAKLIFLGSLGAGLVGAIAFVLFCDLQRPRIHSREKAIEILGAPVLARLPEVRT